MLVLRTPIHFTALTCDLDSSSEGGWLAFSNAVLCIFVLMARTMMTEQGHAAAHLLNVSFPELGSCWSLPLHLLIQLQEHV